MSIDKTYDRKNYRRNYNARVKYINISLSPDLHKALTLSAQKRNQTVTSYFRSLALKAFRKEIITHPELEADLRELKFLMRNIASNVNQMARHSNRLRKMVEEDQLLKQLQALEQAVQTYTKMKLRHCHDHKINDP